MTQYIFLLDSWCDPECEPGCSEEGRVSSMRKHLRGEKPFEQPTGTVLAYQYDVNKKRRGLSSGNPVVLVKSGLRKLRDCCSVNMASQD